MDTNSYVCESEIYTRLHAAAFRGKSYENRRRDYEREIAADAKDKIKEKEELDEIKRKLMEEGIPNPDEEINKVARLIDLRTTLTVVDIYPLKFTDAKRARRKIVETASS